MLRLCRLIRPYCLTCQVLRSNLSLQNPNIEIRNPKQIQILKIPKSKLGIKRYSSFGAFAHLNFGFV